MPQFSDYTHHVKCRKKGDKRWRFVSPGGKTSRLRIHAGLFTADTARLFVAAAGPGNPGFEFKTQKIERGKR